MLKKFNILSSLQSNFKYSKKAVIFIVILSIVFSFIIWILTKNYYESFSKEKFKVSVNENMQRIEKQMSSYENVLRSGIGLFHASDKVTRQDWFDFTQTIKVKQKYPGIQGFGFTIMLAPDEITTLEKKMRAEGFPSFTLKPPGKREQYSSILYLEPLDKRNIQAIGYDMFSQVTRRTAMERARDTGEATISGKVTLVQEIDSDVQAGMLMYFPLYKKKFNTDNTQERKKALIGFVYGAFRMNDLMNKIKPNESISDFEIYDSAEMSEKSLMYRSFEKSSHNAKYHTKKITKVSNHTWYVHFSSTQKFDTTNNEQYPLLLTLFWLSVYFILLFIILALIKSRHLLQSQAIELRKLSQVVEQSPNGIIITNVNNEIEYSNSSFSKITGYSKLEAIGKNTDSLISDRTSTKTYNRIKDSIKRGKSWYGEFISNRKNGPEHTLSIVSFPIIQDNGNKSNYVSIIEDITHEKELENELIRAKEVAEKANKAKSDFLANMSHEIRTPLNGILGLINLVLKSGLNQQQRDYLEKSIISSKALLNVINDILDYSKIEAGKLNLENNIFELDSVISNIKDLFEYQANNKGLKININLKEHFILIGDPLCLTQILTNIVGNAIKFTDKGTIYIDVELTKEDDYYMKLKFTIKDSGIGMSEEVLNNLFMEFSQADNSITRKYGGTGLGLTISKQLINLMSGDIWVTSKKDEGSEFVFTATFGKVENEDSSKNLQNQLDIKEQKITYDTTKLIGSHILLVEDNKINQIVALGILEGLEINVDVATNGKEAVQMIEDSKEYDLILMDLQMPIMDGFEASKRIRYIDENIPIVALSAAVMQEDLVKTAEAKMSAHLAKPIDENELIETLLKFIKPKKSSKKELKSSDTKLKPDELITEFYGVDLDKLKKRIGNKPKIIKQLLSSFCKEYENVEQILDISKVETDEFNNAIHSLKGVSGNISLTEIYELTNQIYNTQDISLKKELTSKLIDIIKKSVENIKSSLYADESKVSTKEYKKDDVLKYVKEIQEDLKHFKAISLERVEHLEMMLAFHTEKGIIKELKTDLIGYKYKDAEKILSNIYKNIGELR
ncbi:CHASE domain-containing protein [Sulfurimonas sp. CS5]|uniref:CHASE domain-containing protein n=1 Tax=Sulfurimonas sp. CS5 TaxID=3391145 RepID=UPI0039EA80BE